MTAAALRIVATGAVTAVGLSSRATCDAVRAGTAGFGEVGFFVGRLQNETMIGAAVPSVRPPDEDDYWLERNIDMASAALLECVTEAGADVDAPLVLVCVREEFRELPDEELEDAHLLAGLRTALGRELHRSSRVLRNGRAGVFEALLEARTLLDRGEASICFVGGVDSYLNSWDVTLFEDAFRIKRQDVGQGFIPGEGAAFVAVEGRVSVSRAPAIAQILGIGLSTEPEATTAVGSGHPTGAGLLDALRAAERDAGVDESVVQFRVSDLNGEWYGGMDAMLAMSRFYRTRRENLSIVHAADSVGEIGAAAGALQLIVAARAICDGHAPGEVAMCEASSDAGLRAACLLRGVRGDPEQRIEALARGEGISASDSALAEIVELHASEAAFLWSVRRRAVTASSFALRSLEDWDERIDAPLAALYGGSAGEILEAFAVLESDDAGTAFAAAALSLVRDRGRFGELLERARNERTVWSEVASALGWLPAAVVAAVLRELLESSDPAHLSLGVRACASHWLDPGDALRRGLENADTDCAATCARVTPVFGQMGLDAVLHAGFDSSDPRLRLESARGAALLGSRAGALELRAAARAPAIPAEAIEVGIRALPLNDARLWLDELLAEPDPARAIVAAGALGDSASIPWLIEQMQRGSTARAAGEAFAAITGADLDGEKLAGRAPPDAEPDTLEDPAQESVELDPDLDALWPVPELVARWWLEHRGSFPVGRRYLLGRELSPQAALAALVHGNQRQRAAGAIELVLRVPGAGWIDVSERASHQRRRLAQLGA